MKPGRTSRQSQRDYTALFCWLTPPIARLTFNVRRPTRMKHAAGSLFWMSSERSPFSERAVPLRGVKKKKERFGFRTSTSEEEAARFSSVKSGTAVNRQSALADEVRPNQASEPTRLRRSFLFAHAAHRAAHL